MEVMTQTTLDGIEIDRYGTVTIRVQKQIVMSDGTIVWQQPHRAILPVEKGIATLQADDTVLEAMGFPAIPQATKDAVVALREIAAEYPELTVEKPKLEEPAVLEPPVSKEPVNVKLA